MPLPKLAPLAASQLRNSISILPEPWSHSRGFYSLPPQSDLLGNPINLIFCLPLPYPQTNCLPQQPEGSCKNQVRPHPPLFHNVYGSHLTQGKSQSPSSDPQGLPNCYLPALISSPSVLPLLHSGPHCSFNTPNMLCPRAFAWKAFSSDIPKAHPSPPLSGPPCFTSS